MSDAVKKEAPKPQITGGRFKVREFESTCFSAIAEAGTKFDQVSDPSYWAHVAPQLKPFDEITVRAEDGAWWAKLLVTDSDRNWAKTIVIQEIDLVGTDAGVVDVDGYEVRWRGAAKFSIVRVVDNAVIQDGFVAKADAYAALAKHARKAA